MSPIATEPLHSAQDAYPRVGPVGAAIAMHCRRDFRLAARPAPQDHKTIAQTGAALFALIFVAGVVGKLWGVS